MSSLTAINLREDLEESCTGESVPTNGNGMTGERIQLGSRPYLTAISRVKILLLASATALVPPVSNALFQESVSVRIESELRPDRHVQRRKLTGVEVWEMAQAARIRAEEAELRYWEEESRRMDLWEDLE
jgi:hypothetical protein